MMCLWACVCVSRVELPDVCMFQGDVTFTPRLVALDLRGSLHSLRQDGTLYSKGREEGVKWSDTHRASTASFTWTFCALSVFVSLLLL